MKSAVLGQGSFRLFVKDIINLFPSQKLSLRLYSQADQMRQAWTMVKVFEQRTGWKYDFAVRLVGNTETSGNYC